MKYLFAYALLCSYFYGFAQNNSVDKRPKIGIVLSGGGAKGLAHIGILKAIDSAGLKVDYITGTSMGAIIGAMYAVGYSSDSIEKLAREIDVFNKRAAAGEETFVLDPAQTRHRGPGRGIPCR